MTGLGQLTGILLLDSKKKLFPVPFISPKLALALVRNSLVQSFGLMSSLLWARHIIVRFRDAVVRTPRRQVAADQNSVPDDIFPDPWRNAYFGPYVPGA